MSTRDDGDSTRGSSRTAVEEISESVVLLADDEDDFRETLRIWLPEDGELGIREASNGKRALAKLDETVDVLVLDRQLPHLSGSEVVERLSEQSFDGEVVVVSAFEPDRHLSTEMVADYLTKPVGRQQFLDTLDRHV